MTASMSKNECYARLEDWLSEEGIESSQPTNIYCMHVKDFNTTTEEALEIAEVINKEELWADRSV